MLTLLGAALGFVSSLVPDLVKLFSQSQDRKHELTILNMQLEQQRQGHSERLEEIHLQADIAESKALYKTYATGIRWVDALNGTVRPVLAYAFFLLYFSIKWMQYSLIEATMPLPWQLNQLWSQEDQAIFAGIIAFYFGQRAMRKVREGR